MSTNNFVITYSSGTVSSVLLHVTSYLVNGKHEAQPIILACEANDFFSEISDSLDALAETCGALHFEATPSDVYNTIFNTHSQCAYDELGAEALLAAVKIWIEDDGAEYITSHLQQIIKS